MKITLLAHRGHVVVVPEAAVVDPTWVPSGNRDGHCFLGSVLLDTRAHLHASQEALDLLARIKNGRDAIGDWDWWACDDGKHACSWFGPIFRIVDPATAVGARGTRVFPDQATLIPNDVPPGLADEVDAALDKGMAFYREPLDLSDPEPPERNN